MPNVLEVKIIGDVTDLQKSLKQAESLQAQYTASIEKTSNELKESITVTAGYKKAIEDLNTAFKNGTISSKEYSKQLANLKRDEKEATIATADLRKELSNLKREQKELGGSFQKDLTPKIANGGNALMQFSRIAQDAPFGIMGIGNNITATAEAFGHLQKQAGGTVGALKAVAGSLVGSGGILLAVSLVTSALTYMSQKGLTIGDVFNKITGSFNEARASAQALNIEAVKGSADQIASMNAYVSVAKNVNISMSDRLLAVQKLQSEYPAYFGNLTKEQILNGNVAGAVRGVTQALIAKAKAAALTDRIVKLAEEEEKVQNSINNSIISQFKLYRLSKKESADAAIVLNKQLRGEIDLVAELDAGRANSLSKAEKTALAAYQYSQTLKDLGVELRSNKKEQDRLTESLEDNYAASIKLETKVDKTKPPKVYDTPIVEPLDITIQPILDVKKTTEALLKVKNEFGKLQEQVIKFEEIKPIDFKITSTVSKDFVKNLYKAQTLTDKYRRMTGEELVLPEVITDDYLKSLETALQASEIFGKGASSAINSLAGDLASSLETGNKALDAFVGSVIQGLAQVAAAQLTGLIAKQAVATASLGTDAAVATGNAVVAATETASSTGPAAAFVLPALVGAAIGFIAAAFSGIKFAHGGVVPGGSFTGDKIPAMLNSGETVMNSQQQANTLMAIANGNSNSLQGNRVSNVFVLDTKLRGADILLSVKREERKR